MTRFRSLWPMHPPMHWCIPHVAEPGPLWNAASWVILKMVGGSSRLFMNNFADLRVINKEVLMKAIDERPPGVPLLTVCNHMSVLDDPMLWGMLPLSYFRPGKVRWTIAAEDICFMRKIYALIFGLGQVFPVRRGAGVVQWPVTDFAVDMLNKGQWVHIFPEGKINPLKNVYRMKWGVGEMIAQSRVPPIVLPFWHEGMEDVMPDDNSPRIPRPFKKVTVLVGEPLRFDALVQHHRNERSSEETLRSAITDAVQHSLWALKAEMANIHAPSRSQ